MFIKFNTSLVFERWRWNCLAGCIQRGLSKYVCPIYGMAGALRNLIIKAKAASELSSVKIDLNMDKLSLPEWRRHKSALSCFCYCGWLVVVFSLFFFFVCLYVIVLSFSFSMMSIRKTD